MKIEIVFDTPSDGKLTWEMPKPDMGIMKLRGINPRDQAERLKKVMKPTAEIFATLMHSVNLGAPGSPADLVAFLSKLDSNTRKLIADYLTHTDNA